MLKQEGGSRIIDSVCIKVNVAIALLLHLVLALFFISNALGEENQAQAVENTALHGAEFWRFSNSLHSSFLKLGSNDAQEGRHLIEIDSTRFTFPYEFKDEKHSYPVKHQPRGFLFQSVAADRYICLLYTSPSPRD